MRVVVTNVRRTPAVGPLEKGSEKGETPVLVGCASIARVVGVELLGIAAQSGW